MFQLAVNVLGTLTAALCAFLLLRGYARGRQKLLLWCGLCFVGLTFSNGLLIADLYLYPTVNFYRYRLAAAAIPLLLMVYGLIFEADRT